MFIQEIQECNWDDILRIQDQAYRDIGSEELNVLKNKLEYSPSTCLVSVSEANEVQGYLLAHPWSGKEPPKLFRALPSISDPGYLFLHDMAVSPKFRSLGVGAKLIEHLVLTAKSQHIDKILLVAVQGSCGFWANIGFDLVTDVGIDASYGVDAVLMKMSLPT